MLNIGLSVVTAAALLLSLPAGANGTTEDRETQHNDAQTEATVQQSTSSDQDDRRFNEALTASDARVKTETSAGAASGEPAHRDVGDFNQQEFLRNVWTAP